MVSVVIVSYNTRDILRKCLEALFAHTLDLEFEVFVVDNDSRDGSAEMVAQEFPRVILTANKENLGFAAANNQAFSRAGGEFILLLNPDAFVRPGAISTAAEFMRSNPSCGICGGKILNTDGSLNPSARRFPGWTSKLFILTGLSSRFHDSPFFNRHDFGGFAHDRVMEVDWVPGTFMLLRRKMLDRIGFFDERFYIYYEETDLCLRAKKAGWKVFFIPDAQVEHIGGASSKTRKDKTYSKAASQVVNFRMRSEYLYFRKNKGLFSVLANAGVEIFWHLGRITVNRLKKGPEAGEKLSGSVAGLKLIRQALADTRLGRKSPRRPW
jgi:GT2 family glycosyltransferase